MLLSFRLLSLVFSFITLSVFAQFDTDYVPLKKTSSESEFLIKSVRDQETTELEKVKSPQKLILMKSSYNKISRLLVDQIKNGNIIDDDSIHRYTNSIFNTIIDANHLPERKRTLLISRNWVANAACYGEGTFLITAGLLSKSENESQIAFSIAHELAHYELGHVFKKIEREAENHTSKEVRKKATGIMVNDNAKPEDLDELRDIVYTETRFSRRIESQADSLAIVYLKHTPYNLTQGVRELYVLDSALYPKYDLGDDWFKTFQFSKYPFQQYWLKPKLSVYSAKQESAFIFAVDSLYSHPEIAARVAALQQYLTPDTRPVNQQADQLLNSIRTKADFECVQTAYHQKQYDVCLYYALQLLSVYPANSYLTTMVGAVLLRLYIAKDYGSISKFVQEYTAYYPDQLKQVNAFLYNLNKEELAELAYHFLNTRPHFNSKVEMHYYLLWRVCKNTQRTDVQEKIKLAYKTKFDKKISSFPDPFQTDVPRTKLVQKPSGF